MTKTKKVKPMSLRERKLRERIADDLMICADEIGRRPPADAAGMVGDRLETARRATIDTYEAAARRVAAGASRERRGER